MGFGATNARTHTHLLAEHGTDGGTLADLSPWGQDRAIVNDFRLGGCERVSRVHSQCDYGLRVKSRCRWDKYSGNSWTTVQRNYGLVL